jgi:hypothetical protein
MTFSLPADPTLLAGKTLFEAPCTSNPPVLWTRCLRELRILEPSVDKGIACSNLFEEYCECVRLILLLPLLFPEYSFTSHFIQHCTAITKMFMPFLNLHFFIVALPHASSSIHNIFEGGLCIKQNFMFAHCSVATVLKCYKPNHRNKHTVDNDNSLGDITCSKVMSWMLRTPDAEISRAVLFILNNCQILGTFEATMCKWH